MKERVFAALLIWVLSIGMFTSLLGTKQARSESYAAPTIDWSRIYAHSESQDIPYSLAMSNDGGYVLAGYSWLFVPGKYDAWLVKADSAGNMQWNQKYGGIGFEIAYSVIQTSDGGYVLVGSGPSANFVKTYPGGGVQWTRMLTGCVGREVIQTSDGGYAVAATGAANLVKIDASGNQRWSRTYGGDAYSLIQTVDGGYALAGGSSGLCWLVKTDADGNVQWSRTYANTGTAYSLVKTFDGGYALATWSVLKTDTAGNFQWCKSYAGSARDIVQTPDGGYAIVGCRIPNGSSFPDMWLGRTDSSGDLMWDIIHGSPDVDQAYSVTLTSDGGYAFAGFYRNGPEDFCLVKTMPDQQPEGDLIAISIRAVQVVYGANLIIGKQAEFRIYYESTFSKEVATAIRIDLVGFNYASYSFNCRFLPGMNYIWLHKENPTAPVITPQLKNAKYSFTIDPPSPAFPYGKILETSENDNIYPSTGLWPHQGVRTGTMKVLYMPLYYPSETPPDWNRINSMREASDKFLKAVLPVGDSSYNSEVTTTSFPLDANPSRLDLWVTLCFYEAYGVLWGYNRTVAMVPDDYFASSTWLHNWLPNDFPSLTDGLWWGGKTIIVEEGYWKTVAHEIGHSLGLWTTSGQEEYNQFPLGRAADGYWVSPSNDPYTGNPLNGEIVDGGCFMGGYAGNCHETYSYSSSRRVWVDTECYENVINRLLLSPQDPEVLFVSGIVFKNDTVKQGPWFRIANGVPDIPLSASGTYTLRFLDAVGSVIAQTGFNVTFELLGQPTDFTGFSFNVPYVQGTSRVEIARDGSPIATRSISLHSPTVQITSPNDGIYTSGENVTINWSASDLDEDNMTFTLAYSPNNGESWVPIASGLDETNYVWNTSYLQKGSEYLLKIMVTDGMNTGEDVSDSTLTVRVHDVESTEVTSAKMVVGEDYGANVNVTVKNIGDFTETFNVTAYANTTLIGKQEVTLGAGATATVTFEWNTAGLAKGSYVLSAVADAVNLEFFTADNMVLSDTVLVTIAGDINGDHIVDVHDIHLFGKRFNAGPLDPLWVAEADINNDLTIDAEDLRIINAHYGQSW